MPKKRLKEVRLRKKVALLFRVTATTKQQQTAIGRKKHSNYSTFEAVLKKTVKKNLHLTFV